MFKRSIVALIALATMFCHGVNAEPVQNLEQMSELGDVELEYKAREIGNGNSRDGFHERVWTDFESSTREPVKRPTDTIVIPTPHNDATYNADDTWLIYYYVCGADLEENWKTATSNFHEIQRVQLPPNVKILIKTGGASTWHHENVTGGGLWLYSSASRQIQSLESLHEDMGNADTLKSFLKYGEDNYKSDHKVLIFQNHGGFNGVCYDKTFDGNPATENHLRFDDLHDSLSAFYAEFPQTAPFELIAFDTCLSGSYECAKSLESFTRYMMASETSTYSWDYTPWLKRFTDNTAINGGTLGHYIAEESQKAYGTSIGANNEYCIDVTNFAVIDMNKLPALTKAYDEFFGAAVERGKSLRGFYANFDRIAKDPYQSEGAEHYDSLYVDLGRLAERTQNFLPEGQNLLMRVQEAVWSLPGKKRNGLGISTYYPYNRSRINEFYNQQSPSVNQKTFYYNLLNNVHSETTQPWTPADGQQSFVPDPYNIRSLQGTPLNLGEDNHVTATLNAEQLEIVSDVRCTIMALVDPANEQLKEALGLEDYSLVFLGNDADVKVDWQTGTIKDNFRATWPMLDGHVIFLRTDFASDDYILYTSPVYHNGEEKFLKVAYSYAAKKYIIIGVCEEVDEYGTPTDNITPLKEGDDLTPVFLALVDSKSKDVDYNEVAREVEYTWSDGRKIKGKLLATEGASFTIGKNPRIEDKIIPDAPYGYAFQFFAPSGEAEPSVSQIVFLNVENGKVTNAMLIPYDDSIKVDIKEPEE